MKGSLSSENIVFYLKLSSKLGEEYFGLERRLRTEGKTVIPVDLVSMLELLKIKNNAPVVIIIKSSQELAYFKKKTHKILTYLLSSERIDLFMASSFGQVNFKKYQGRKFYNFVKLPVSMDFFARSISKTIDIRQKSLQAWPGGDRASYHL